MKLDNQSDTSDIFTKFYLEKLYFLQKKIEDGNIKFLDKNYNVSDFCFKPVSDQGCLITSPMDFWKMNLDEMKNDPDIKETPKCLKKKSKDNIPCTDKSGVPIQIDVFT